MEQFVVVVVVVVVVFTTPSAISVQVGKLSLHPVNVSIMTKRYLYP